MKKESAAFVFRAPREVLDAVRALAQRDARSINGQLVHLVERSLTEELRKVKA